MRFVEDLPIRVNVKIDLFDRGKRKRWHRSSHNIITNTGRLMVLENITAQSFSGGSFARHQDTVARYIGFGIGGSRQTDPSAGASPLSDAHPAGYGGTNIQTDDDPAVGILERPVEITPGVWMKQLATPGTFGPVSTTFITNVTTTEINFVHPLVPISEIALYKSSADPTLPNGGVGAYPGPPGHVIAYDTFTPFPKSGLISFQVQWTWSAG